MGERTRADRWRRHLLLGALALGAGLAFWVASRYLSFAELQKNYEALAAWREDHMVLAAAAYMAVYIAAVAFSVPGAVWLTLVGGFLFGIIGGAVMVVISATIGATLIFLAARSVLSGFLRRRAEGWIERLGRGFRQGEISFLLILRLVPVVPFFIANLVPAFLGARLLHFVWTTLVGVTPATLVFVSIGSGLGEQLALGEKPDLGVIFEPHILGPLLGLAALSALPLVLRSFGFARAERRPAE